MDIYSIAGFPIVVYTFDDCFKNYCCLCLH